MFQIQRLGLEKQVIEMRAKGLSNREIAVQLKKQFGIEMSHMSISRYRNSSKEIEKSVIGKKKELREKLAQQRLDIHQQIIDSIKLIKRKIEKLENTDEHYALQGYFKELRAHLEFVSKQLGELDPKISIEQTIIYVRSNIIEIINEMPELAKKDLAQFLIENNIIENLTQAYLANQGLKGIEKLGYFMIKTEDKTLIETLKREGKITTFRPV